MSEREKDGLPECKPEADEVERVAERRVTRSMTRKKADSSFSRKGRGDPPVGTTTPRLEAEVEVKKECRYPLRNRVKAKAVEAEVEVEVEAEVETVKEVEKESRYPLRSRTKVKAKAEVAEVEAEVDEEHSVDLGQLQLVPETHAQQEQMFDTLAEEDHADGAEDVNVDGDKFKELSSTKNKFASRTTRSGTKYGDD